MFVTKHYAQPRIVWHNLNTGKWNAWERKVSRVFVGKPEGKRPLGRPRRRWEDGIRMDLREIG
jgi:hypothetical protein